MFWKKLRKIEGHRQLVDLGYSKMTKVDDSREPSYRSLSLDLKSLSSDHKTVLRLECPRKLSRTLHSTNSLYMIEWSVNSIRAYIPLGVNRTSSDSQPLDEFTCRQRFVCNCRPKAQFPLAELTGRQLG